MKERSQRMKMYLLIAIIVVLVAAIVLVVCVAIGKGNRKQEVGMDVSRQEEVRDVLAAMTDDEKTDLEPENVPEDKLTVTEDVPTLEEDVNPNAEPEAEPVPEVEPAVTVSVWDGYWYLFNAENKYCTEYQFHEDRNYQVRERYVSTGKYKTKPKEGIHEFGEYDDADDGDLWLFLDDTSWWSYNEEQDLLWTFRDNSWGTESAIVMVHYPTLPETSELLAGYDIFMQWSETDVYAYDSLLAADYYLMYAYPKVFQESSSGGTYANGAAMEPLEILLTHVNSYLIYQSEDAEQALFYHVWDIDEDFESEEMVRTIEQKYNLGKGNYMVEEESYWDVEGFRLLLNIDGRWHFIRSVIHERTNEMVVMEYSFTGENYWPYNPTIAHLEYNLQFVDLTE